MSRSAFAVAVIVGAMAIAACEPSSEGTSPAANYNLVLISVDALRADHLGTYGYDRPTTPFLDSLASESVVFERAYAPSSFTLQSVSALLTGMLPTSGGSVSLEAQPHENAETLSRLYRAADLHTGIFSNQFLLQSRGFTRGFEDIRIADSAQADQAETALDVTENALQFVDDYAPERFFIYAHYVEPHQTYSPPADTASRFGVNEIEVSVSGLSAEISSGEIVPAEDPRIDQLTARYDAEIATVDQAIEALVAGLGERGLADNTLIIVTGSQGQEFLEHDYLGHAWTLYEELLRVPLIMHAPGLIEPQRVESAVSTIDIYPTLIELFGLDLDTSAWQVDGGSFLGDTLDIRERQDPIFSELVVRERCIIRSIVLDEWKYIAEFLPCAVEDRQDIQSGYLDLVTAIAEGEVEAPSLWGEIQQEMLFNLNEDPGETINLLEEESDQLAYMRGRLNDYQQYAEANALRAIEPSAPRNMDAAQRARLCGGGYFGC